MEVTGTLQGQVLICKLAGRLDASTSPQADETMKSLLAGCSNMAGDLSELEYISSAGLRILLMRAKDLGGKGGKLCLFGLRPEVKQVFEIAGFTKIIPIFPSIDEAMASLEG